MSAPTFPLQQGSNKALQILAPTFATVVVLAGTWKAKPNSAMKDYKDGTSRTFLTSFTDPGYDFQCTWVVNAGQSLYVKGQSITALTDTVSSPRTFLIVDNDDGEFGGDPCEQQMKLRVKDAQTGLT